MAFTKKKQDDKHLKMLREMVALPNNKQCLDCHQRGPTYVNMTIGSFVCTACSGLLRGLNPPHRVKSISMASFSADEIEFITCHGNEYCRKVWLELYDKRLNNQTECRDESKVKDFMIQKYERKRFYVTPSESMKEEAKRMNEAVINKAPAAKPLKSLLGKNIPIKLQVESSQKTPSSASMNLVSSALQSPGNQSLQQSKSSCPAAMDDLLGGLGNDMFATQAHTETTGGFADFGNFGLVGSPQPQSTSSQPCGLPQHISNGPSNVVTVTKDSQSPAGTGGGDKYSNLSDLFSLENAAPDATGSAGWSSSLNMSKNVTWGTETSSLEGMNWGGDCTMSTGMGGVNWNGSSSQPALASVSGLSWGGSSAASSATSRGSTPAMQQTNVADPFGGSGSSNVPQATWPPATGMVKASKASTTNPFGTKPGVGAGGFGACGTQGGAAPPTPAFGQFGTPVSSAGVGYAQFGGTSAGSGFGQFTVHTGGFGGAPTNTAVGFGAQSTLGGCVPAAFGQPQQQFGGVPGAAFGSQSGQGLGQLGQPVGYRGQMQEFGFRAPAQCWDATLSSTAAANPFMSTAQQYSVPKTGLTNPFL